MRPDIRRMLVPVDFSAGSARAVEYAAVLASALGASVHLLHVLEDSFLIAAPWEFHPAESAEERERAVWDTEAKLSAIAAGFRPCGTKVTTEVRSGRAAREIVGVAADRGTNLIVMGTHGRTGLSHVVYGSVAEQVIRKALCPVLAVCERGVDHCPETSAVPAAYAM